MPSALDELWALQQIDSRIFDLEKQLAALDTGAQAKAALLAAQSASETATATLHKLEAEIADVDLASKSTATKIKDVENRMYSGKVTNAKELEAMQADVQMLKRQRDKLETRELELMDEQAEAKEQAEKAALKLLECQKNYQQVAAAYIAARQKLDAELAEARAEREKQAVAAAEASSGYARKYDLLKKKLGKLVVTEISGGSCGVCHINVPADVVKAVAAGEEMVVCESCGRVLYASRA